METREVRARLGRDGDHTVVTYPFGEDLTELTDQFGEEVVYNQAVGAIVISLQAYIRSFLKPDENGRYLSTDEIQQKVNEWKLGTRARGKTAAEKTADLFAKLSPEAKAALLEELSASLDDDDNS